MTQCSLSIINVKMSTNKLQRSSSATIISNVLVRVNYTERL